MIIGNTVRVIGTFVKWDGTPINADSTTLKVYNNKYVLIDTLTLTNTAIGVYQADYLVPELQDDDFGDLIFEFSGIVEDSVELTRIKKDRSKL